MVCVFGSWASKVVTRCNYFLCGSGTHCQLVVLWGSVHREDRGPPTSAATGEIQNHLVPTGGKEASLAPLCMICNQAVWSHLHLREEVDSK